ncbi:MAG TPA: hypothetical protein VMF13_09045 [Luteitalea sp.]|nr:hypothetical protein [Luteitalea sp.]
MIRVLQQGAAWTVVQDGKLLREGAGAAVHKTREQAEQHAARLAAKLHDELQQSTEGVGAQEAGDEGAPDDPTP